MAVWWGATVEYAAALARREREGSLTLTDVSSLLERLRALSQTWHEVRPDQRLKSIAMRLLRVHPLRAADALQLAAALAAADDDPASIGFISFDAQLNEAASREGFAILGG